MNYLNTLLGQARDLVMSMTPQARLMAVLMTTAIVISSAFLVRGTSQAKMEKLFNGYVFKDRELYQAEIALGKAKLSDYQRSGNQLLVPAAKKDLYVKALAEGRAFPKDLGGFTQEALSNGNMLEPFVMIQKRMQAAKQQEVSAAISRLPFVEEAWVEYDEKKEGFARNVKQTASVFVMPMGTTPLTEVQKTNIMRMVQGAFAGLAYENVSIMDYSDGSAKTGETDAASTQHDKYMQAKRQHEEEIRSKALDLLRDFNTDYGNVVVQVAAEIDRTLREATETFKLDEKPSPLQSSNTTKTVTQTKNQQAGRPGFEPNAGPNRSAQLAATQPESTSNIKESSDNEKFRHGHATTLIDKVGLSLKQARMSVKIPQSYYQREWERRWQYTQPADKRDSKPDPMTATQLDELRKETKTRIEGTLAILLNEFPADAAGADKIKLIAVDDYVDVPPPKFEGPSLAQTGVAWLANSWQTLAMLGLALFAIVMLRSAVKSQPKTNDEEFTRGFGVSMDSALAGGELTSFGQEADEEEGNSAVPESAARRFAATGEKVRDELANVVRENPTVAVNILRSWIDAA